MNNKIELSDHQNNLIDMAYNLGVSQSRDLYKIRSVYTHRVLYVYDRSNNKIRLFTGKDNIDDTNYTYALPFESTSSKPVIGHVVFDDATYIELTLNPTMYKDWLIKLTMIVMEFESNDRLPNKL